MTMHIKPHGLSANQLGRQDARNAVLGQLVGNPFFPGSPEYFQWFAGFDDQMAEVSAAELEAA